MMPIKTKLNPTDKSNRKSLNYYYNISAELPIEEHCRILCGGVDLTGANIEAKDDSKALESTLAKTNTNPYVKAREEVLAKMNTACRNQILEMESKQDMGNRIYTNFVDSVAKLGDTLGNKSK